MGTPTPTTPSTNCINEIICCSLDIPDEFHFWRKTVSSSSDKIYYVNTISDMMSVNDLKVFLWFENVCKEIRKKKLKRRKTGKRWLKTWNAKDEMFLKTQRKTVCRTRSTRVRTFHIILMANNKMKRKMVTTSLPLLYNVAHSNHYSNVDASTYLSFHTNHSYLLLSPSLFLSDCKKSEWLIHIIEMKSS